MGIENKSLGLWAFLIALVLEQLVVKFHDTNCFSAYFSLWSYMKQIPDELSHLTMGYTSASKSQEFILPLQSLVTSFSILVSLISTA